MSSYLEAAGFAPEPTRYLTAEVCVNGHPATHQLEYERELATKFCAQCGAETIRACPDCGAAIRGSREVNGSLMVRRGAPPSYCHNCGKPFPWTTAKLAAAREYAAELDGLDETEKTRLQGAIDDLASDGPRTELAANRFKTLMSKAGQAVGSGLYKIVLDVATEAAKKAIMG